MFSTVVVAAAAAAIVCVVAAATTTATAETVTRHTPMVVLSFDGFRADYVRTDTTPHLARLRDASAAPPYMRAAFPTKTFVNHFTMATGLHPETHGVLDNFMFDDNHNGTMYYSYELFHYDESVVPIWIQNEYTGDGRHSGVMMWPGSEFPYQGKSPTYIQKYNRSIPWISRIDKMISWIKDENRPANLVFGYFEEPDKTGHIHGVGSQEIKNQIVRVDATVKYILDQIKNENLENKINLIILSDHGMDTITYDRIIYLDDYVSNTTCKLIITGANAFVYPYPGKFDEVYSNLTNGVNISGKFDVYKKDQLPDRWHMKNTSRLTGILYLLAKPGYAFWDDYFQEILKQTTKEKFRAGTHGYDNEHPLMRAIFIASGPAFKRNFIAQPFDNVDLYPLISHVMGLKELATNNRPNGTMDGVNQLLSSSKSAAATIASSPHFRSILVAVLTPLAIVRRL